ncbi:uncharacterized protein LOC143300767 [Babylonia areolata]|uniref:uncharacterized protein LOC143300767 n=1 Tax=Babylonia areolata TaxID=304850 RepID=UPI003FD43591
MGLVVQVLLAVVLIFCGVVMKSSDAGKNKSCVSSQVKENNAIIFELFERRVKLLAQLQDLKKDLEKHIENLKAQIEGCKGEVEWFRSQLKEAQAKLQYLKKCVEDLQRKLREMEEMVALAQGLGKNRGVGSTYTRWGRKTCDDDKETKLVYTGIVGGKSHTEKGSGTNPLCMTTTLTEYNVTSKPSNYGRLYGSEYEAVSTLQNHKVPCTVCQVPASNTIMIPGTNRCPPGWKARYTGYLASAHSGHYATEYLCLDGSPETMAATTTNHNGFLLYGVLNACGSLPCPPFDADKVPTCIVCSSPQ